MIAVIFELWPTSKAAYFDLAAELRAELETLDGFISIERFQSLADTDKYLSLSFWRDEASVREWRNRADHRNAQAQGRSGILRDYRLRVASVSRDYGMTERHEAPSDSCEVHG